MATLTYNLPAISGNDFVFTPADVAGDQFPNNGEVTLILRNGSGSDKTVTFRAPNVCNFGLADSRAHDLVYTLPAGATKFLGNFDVTRFNDTNSMVNITYDDVTGLDLAPVHHG